MATVTRVAVVRGITAGNTFLPVARLHLTVNRINEIAAIMKSSSLPKSVRAAINAQAFKIAQTHAYEALRAALEQRAQVVMQKPDSSVQDVILVLESSRDFADLMVSAIAGCVQARAPGAGWPFPTSLASARVAP